MLRLYRLAHFPYWLVDVAKQGSRSIYIHTCLTRQFLFYGSTLTQTDMFSRKNCSGNTIRSITVQ